MHGKSNQKVDNRFADRLGFVGEASNPIFFGTRKEISELCDQEFYYYLDVWSKFHIGMGLPSGKSYLYEQPHIVEAIEALEWMYRSYSGVEIISRKLDGIGAYLKAGFRLKER